MEHEYKEFQEYDPPVLYTGMKRMTDVYIPMRDGCQLCADINLPDGKDHFLRLYPLVSIIKICWMQIITKACRHSRAGLISGLEILNPVIQNIWYPEVTFMC